MLKEVVEPTPICPRCKRHTIRKPSGQRGYLGIGAVDVYECPKCQAVYKETEE